MLPTALHRGTSGEEDLLATDALPPGLELLGVADGRREGEERAGVETDEALKGGALGAVQRVDLEVQDVVVVGELPGGRADALFTSGRDSRRGALAGQPTGLSTQSV